MTSSAGETALSVLDETAFQPDAYDIQRTYNVWHGLYEEAHEGRLHLADLKVWSDSGETAVNMSLPKQATSLAIDVIDRTASEPARLDITFSTADYATEEGYVTYMRTVRVNEDGAPETSKILKVTQNKHRKVVAHKVVESGPLGRATLERVDEIFEEVQDHRRQAYESRRQTPPTAGKSVGWLGLTALLHGKKK